MKNTGFAPLASALQRPGLTSRPFRVAGLGALGGPGGALGGLGALEVALGVLVAPGGLGVLVVLPWLCLSSEQDTAPDNPDTNIHLSDATAGPSEVRRILSESRHDVNPFAACDHVGVGEDVVGRLGGPSLGLTPVSEGERHGHEPAQGYRATPGRGHARNAHLDDR
jgi:hypothetical protein